MICRKCHGQGTITIKKDYNYCESCYLNILNHKFRACIGKNKVIRRNEKILIALSGGLGSSALLDLIHTGISLNTHKKLRIEPYFVHLTGEDANCKDEVAKSIVKQCKSYGFNIQLYNISSRDKYQGTKVSTSKTSSNDLTSRIIQNNLANIAKQLNCRLIFTGEPATNLAAKLLSDIVIGRGSQVENDIGFMDNRHDSVKILRPLRDITNEELHHYIKIKGIVPPCNRNTLNNLQSVIDSFVVTLEKDSPATISTICKTADKIGFDERHETENTCKFCKGKLYKDTKKFTAFQATIFSRMISHRKKQYEIPMELMENNEEISDQYIFPFVHQHLCYCCSRSYAEIDDPNLRKHILPDIRDT